MIKKYKQFNEGLLDKLTGPSEEEVLDNFKKLSIIKKGEILFHSLMEYDDKMVIFALKNGADVHVENDYILKFCVIKNLNSLTEYLLNNYIFNMRVINFCMTLYKEEKNYFILNLLEKYKTKSNLKRKINGIFNHHNESILDKLKGPDTEDVWKEFGYDRTFETATEFFLYLIDGIEPIDNNRGIIHWKKDDDMVFEQNPTQKKLYTPHKYFLIMEKIFGFKTKKEIETFIEDIADQYLKLWNYKVVDIDWR